MSKSPPPKYSYLIVPVASIVVLVVVMFTLKQSYKGGQSQDPKERMEQARLRHEQSEREYKLKNEKRVQELREKFREAQTRKSEDLTNYINAEIDLAQGEQSVGDSAKANQLYNDAFILFTSDVPAGSLANVHIRQLWTSLDRSRDLSDQEFETKFKQLLKATDLHDSSDVDQLVLDAVRNRRYRSNGASNSQQKNLLKIAIDAQSQAFGADSPRLESLVRQYSSACESSGDVAEAEKQFLRAVSLKADNNADSRAITQLNLADFYLRNHMNAKADAAFYNAEKICNGAVSVGVARRIANTLKEYRKSASSVATDKVVTSMLALGGDALIATIDGQVEEIVNDYLNSGSLKKAEDLIRKRVAAIETCTQDLVANDWRIKLSDTLLALGQTAESNRIFEQVKNSVALQGGPVDQIVESRAQLYARLGNTAQSNKLKQSLPKQESGPITIKYGLLAYEMVFGRNTSIESFDGSDPQARPTFSRNDDSSICALGSVRKEGNFRYGGTIYGLQLTPNAVSSQARLPRLPLPTTPPTFPSPKPLPGQSAPTPPTFPSPRPLPGQSSPTPPTFPAPPSRPLPALIAPPDSRLLSAGELRGRPLEPGDYKANDLSMLSSSTFMRDPGLIRIFLVDSLGGSSVIEAPYMPFARSAPINRQIWYNGTKKLKMRGFSGLIYAPNATVEIPFNGRFVGAIVARRIVGEGNNNYKLDSSLIGKTFD